MYYTATPLPDELLSSWLIRSSIKNGTDPIGFSEGIWFNQRIWTKDIDRHFPKEKIQYLAQHTTLSFSEIYNMTLESVYLDLIKPQTKNPKKHWQYIIPTGIRNRTTTNGLHFCPLCIAEPAPYMKKQWRLSWNCICEKHHILLQLHCSKCGHCFSPHLISYTDTDFTKCQYCKTPMSKSNNHDEIEKSVLQLQTFLNNSLKEKTVVPSGYPIHDAEISDLFATVRGFMLFFRDIIHSRAYQKYREPLFMEMNFQYRPMIQDHTAKQISIDALPVEERYRLLEMVAAIFTFSLDEIVLILKKTDVSKQLFARSIALYSPTLAYIVRALKDRPKTTKNTITPLHREYQPNTQEQVEKLMHDIRTYL